LIVPCKSEGFLQQCGFFLAIVDDVVSSVLSPTQEIHYCGGYFREPLGRNLTLAKDKEMGFRQESDIGHGM